VGAEVARERVPRRGHDHLMPVDVPRLVQPGNDQVDARRQGAIVSPQALDHHRLRLLHDADALGHRDDHEQRDRAEQDQPEIHESSSFSTMSLVPSTCTTITRVPGSSTPSPTDAPRQSSPFTLTLPRPVCDSIRSLTRPVWPTRASTFVRSSPPLPETT